MLGVDKWGRSSPATGVGATLYAGTPPLEAIKLIMGMTFGNEGKGLHIMLNQVKRSYFHAEAKRELYVDIPKDPEWTPHVVGRLRLFFCGTRDAAMFWQKCVAKHLLPVGCMRGKSNHCVYHHGAHDLRTRGKMMTPQFEASPDSGG